MSAAEPAAPVSAAEGKTLFAGLGSARALLLAVSGGPDSTALMVLAARWRAGLSQGPQLLAVTVDHGLRAESGREAQAAKLTEEDPVVKAGVLKAELHPWATGKGVLASGQPLQ